MIQVNREHKGLFDPDCRLAWGSQKASGLYPDNVSVAVNKLMTCGLENTGEELQLEQQKLYYSVSEMGLQKPAKVKECLSEPESQLGQPACVKDLNQVTETLTNRKRLVSETVAAILSQVDRIPTTKEETVLQLDN